MRPESQGKETQDYNTVPLKPSELLTRINQLRETERIEAKQASQMGESILQTVCALSNEPGLAGGYVLLGVEEVNDALFPMFSPTGVGNADRVIEDLVTQCASVFNVPVRVDVEQEIVSGKLLVAVRVPEAAPGDKPVFFRKRGLPDGAWRRYGSTDQRCTEDDLAALYQGRGFETYDYSLIHDADLDDMDEGALAEYRRFRAEVNPAAEELQWSAQDLLRSLGCLRRDPAGVMRPTAAGILLFGTPMALRRVFPMMRVDYIRVPGREWVENPDERFVSQDMRGPLMQLVRRAQAAIIDDLPQSFSLPEHSLQREDRPLISLRVIREAIVNALMHRNYRVHGATQIIRYANRLEIRNPGYSLVAEEHLGEPDSQTRNPKIAAVLHDTRFAENKGSGIRVMRTLMEETGLSTPLFESDRQRDKFVATFLFHHFLNPDDIHWLGHFRDASLSDEEARALIFVREVGAINAPAYSTITKTDRVSAVTHLRRLVDLGLLKVAGRGSDIYFVPGERLLTAKLAADATHKHEERDTQAQHTSAQRDTQAAVPQELGGATLAEVPERGTPEFMRAAILTLCQAPLTADQVGEKLHRDPRYVRQRYLSSLAESGQLTRIGQPPKPVLYLVTNEGLKQLKEMSGRSPNLAQQIKNVFGGGQVDAPAQA